MRVSRGPGKTQWLRGLLDQKFDKLPFAKRLNLCLRYGDESLRQAMAARLLEIAFTDQVIVIGRDEDGPIERASSRESIEAIKVLYSYDLGTPAKMERELPAIEVPPGASLLDVAMQIYRAKLSAGEMTEPELAEMVRLLLAAEKDKALIFLKALGSKLQSLQSQQIDRLLAAYEQDPAGFLGFVSAKVPEPDAMEVTPVAPIEVVAPVVAEQAKRAAEAQASGQATSCAEHGDLRVPGCEKCAGLIVPMKPRPGEEWFGPIRGQDDDEGDKANGGGCAHELCSGRSECEPEDDE